MLAEFRKRPALAREAPAAEIGVSLGTLKNRGTKPNTARRSFWRHWIGAGFIVTGTVIIAKI